MEPFAEDISEDFWGDPVGVQHSDGQLPEDGHASNGEVVQTYLSHRHPLTPAPSPAVTICAVNTTYDFGCCGVCLR